MLGEKPYQGQEVDVFKANMIIPQIKSAVQYDELEEDIKVEFFDIPSVCPICGKPTAQRTDLTSTFLVCENPSCEGKLINRLDHFCGKKGLDIKGLSKATLEKLIDWGWINGLVDIFELHTHKKEWTAKAGFGEKSVSNILTAIEASREVALDKFIASLGIPLIGTSVAKEIAKKEFDYFNIREDIEGKYDFTLWDGFGEGMCSALLNFDYREADVLANKYLHITNPYWKDPSAPEVQSTKSDLSGKTIVITGKLALYKNRAELVAAIEQAGGKVASAVSKNTAYLINNDNTSGSAKNVSAQKLGVPVVTEQEFVEKFL